MVASGRTGVTVWRRVAQLLVGLVVMGIGIAALKQSRLGLGPWDVLHDGIATRTGIDLGTVGILVGIPIVALWWPLRQRPGIGTLCNLVLIGVAIRVALEHSSPAHGALPRALLLALGLALVALGSGLYLGVELGPGPRDGVMTGLHHRLGWSIRLARTLIELTALAAGIAMGGDAGIGTVLYALGIGPMVQVTMRWFGFGRASSDAIGATPGDAVGLAGE